MTHTNEQIAQLCAQYKLGGNNRPVAVIGEAMIIRGSATALDGADVLILGEVHGPVSAKGAVVIDRGARVLGGVQADRLCLLGEVDAGQGDPQEGRRVQVRSLLHVQSTGRLRAEQISYRSLQIQAGARIAGQMAFDDSQGELELPQDHAKRMAEQGEERAHDASQATARSDDESTDARGPQSRAADGVARAGSAPADLTTSPALRMLVSLPALAPGHDEPAPRPLSEWPGEEDRPDVDGVDRQDDRDHDEGERRPYEAARA